MVFFAFGAIAVAAWLLPASIHVVGWQAATPVRIALLAPWSSLAMWAVVAAGLAGVLVVASRRRWPERISQLSRVCAPLTLLYVWAIPYLPRVADEVPLTLALAGPLRWVVAGVALLGTALMTVNVANPAGVPAWRVRCGRFLNHGLGPRRVFAVSLVVFVALGAAVKSSQGVGGDEPHYLVVAHSLMTDGDLRIENNHRDRHYEAYWSGVLRPHFLQPGLDNIIYSIHAPGLPALLVPFYRVGRQWGAMVFMALVGSLTAASVFALSRRLTSTGPALITWVVVAFSIPFAPQSWLIYPEMPAALVMAWVAAWLCGPLPDRARTWLWRGAAVGFLPWLHTKYSLLLAAATVCLLVTLCAPVLFRTPSPSDVPSLRQRRLRDAVVFLAPMAVSGLLWFGSFYIMYGTPNPTVAYGTDSQLELANVPRGVLGLLWDQEFGLLLYSPIYLLVPVGLWCLLHREETRWPSIALTAVSAGLLISVVPYRMWWGGASVPARFLVPVLPLMAPMIAVAVDHCRNAASRGLVGLLGVASVASFLAAIRDPRAALLFNDRDGTGRLIEAFQGAIELTALLPSFVQSDWTSQLPTLGGWVLASLAAGGMAFLVGRGQRSVARAFWSGVVCITMFAVATATVSGQRVARQPVERGQQEVLAAYDAPRLRAVSYRSGRIATLTETDYYRHATIRRPVVDSSSATSGRSPMERGRVAGPFSLPAGRHVVRLWIDRTAWTAPPGGSEYLWIAYHRSPGVLGVGRPARANPVEITLDLPVSLTSLWIGATADSLRQAVTHVQIDPVSVVPRSQRVSFGNVQYAAGVDETPGRYALHTDDNVFVEGGGFWVRGGRLAALRVSPGGASRLRVRVQSGAVDGPVTVALDGTQEIVELTAGESREFSMALTGGERLVAVSVFPANGFRPSDLGVSSDSRWLGCWVSIELDADPR